MLKKDLSLVATVSLVAIGFLLWLIYYRNPTEAISHPVVEALPLVNAILNSLSASFLVVGIIHIKNKRKESHERMMKLAFVSSALFLISYIAYHYFHGDSKFLGQGWIRPVYFFVLISHIVLSIIALPMVLFTFFMAWKKNWTTHKKIAKWTFPIWLYVSVTGVLIFLFLRLAN